MSLRLILKNGGTVVVNNNYLPIVGNKFVVDTGGPQDRITTIKVAIDEVASIHYKESK